MRRPIAHFEQTLGWCDSREHGSHKFTFRGFKAIQREFFLGDSHGHIVCVDTGILLVWSCC